MPKLSQIAEFMFLDRYTYFSVLDAALLNAGNLVIFNVVAALAVDMHDRFIWITRAVYQAGFNWQVSTRSRPFSDRSGKHVHDRYWSNSAGRRPAQATGADRA
ncbi:hypothetical protein [Burkholderia diffusa]|uniref:hypothetical protein n=1 Tax=Burkholderia diffusa TaxID=488732 RepID=UPI0015898B16|nr:hypothetical protein [Burkholderia diffusa]